METGKFDKGQSEEKLRAIDQYPAIPGSVNLAARKPLEGSGEAQGVAYVSVAERLSYRRGEAVGEPKASGWRFRRVRHH